MKRFARLLALATCCFAFGLLVACHTAPRPPAGRRVVCLVPSVAEEVYALGAESTLAGVTTFCDYPPPVRTLPTVGDFLNPSLERILALKPDLVIATLPEQQPVADKLRELRIPVMISRPASVDDVMAEIEKLGAALGAASQAASVVRSMRSRLDAVRSATDARAHADTPRVYVEISAGPLMSVGRGSFLNDVIRRAGGRNIFAGIDQAYPIVSAEEVIGRDPDAVVILHPLARKADVVRRLGWQNVAAVKTGTVIDDLDENLVLRPGPRVVEGIEALAKRIR